MIRELYNTKVETASAMIGVSDEMILEWSNGEVICPDPAYEEDEDLPFEKEPIIQAFFNPDIFGDIRDKGNLKMGHISLPIPIVNIQYLYGTNPILPHLLQMNRSEVEKIIYNAAYADVNSNEDTLVTEAEKAKYLESHSQANLMIGAEAIRELLNKHGKKDAIPHIILTKLPVTPAHTRGFYRKQANGTEIFTVYDLGWLFHRVAIRSKRLFKLINLSAPQIILLNESRQVQEAVDALINNGARGRAVNSIGIPANSLTELSEMITCIKANKKPEIPEFSFDVTPIFALFEERDKKLEKLEEADYKTYEMIKEDYENRICDVLLPTVDLILEYSFAGYKDDFKEDLERFGLTGMLSATEHYYSMRNEVEKDKILLPEDVFHIIWKQMQVFVKKQIMWTNI